MPKPMPSPHGTNFERAFIPDRRNPSAAYDEAGELSSGGIGSTDDVIEFCKTLSASERSELMSAIANLDDDAGLGQDVAIAWRARQTREAAARVSKMFPNANRLKRG